MQEEVPGDDWWEQFRGVTPAGRKDRRDPRSAGRRLFNATLRVARSGGCWRDLPKRSGPYRTIERLCYRRVEQGVVDRIVSAVSTYPDLDRLAIDATVIRAQARAAGARVKRRALKFAPSVECVAGSPSRSMPSWTRLGCWFASRSNRDRRPISCPLAILRVVPPVD